MTFALKPMSFARHPLDHVLAAAGSVRVMRALLAHGGALSVVRIARETRLTSNGVRRVLAELERSGVVEVLGSDHIRLYRAVQGHPIVEALDALFVAEQARFDTILDSVTSAAADERIVAVWLFGSVARHEDTVDSDFDIAIVVNLDPPRTDAVADGLRDRLREHEKRLGFTVSIVALPIGDIRRLSREHAPLWSDLVRDAQVLKGVPPDRLARRLAVPVVRSASATP